jgi:hypothetical protein
MGTDVATYLNMKESARFLGVSLDTLRRRRADGRLPQRARFTEAELRESEAKTTPRKGTPRKNTSAQRPSPPPGVSEPSATPPPATAEQAVPPGQPAKASGAAADSDPWALNLPRDVKPAKAGAAPPPPAPSATAAPPPPPAAAPSGDFFDW